MLICKKRTFNASIALTDSILVPRHHCLLAEIVTENSIEEVLFHKIATFLKYKKTCPVTSDGGNNSQTNLLLEITIVK